MSGQYGVMERPENQDLDLYYLTLTAAFFLGDTGLIIDLLLFCFLSYKIKRTVRPSVPKSLTSLLGGLNEMMSKQESTIQAQIFIMIVMITSMYQYISSLLTTGFLCSLLQFP